MSRTVEAEYIADQNVLKLTEPLSGIGDHQKVEVEIRPALASADQPWLRLAGSLSDNEGRDLARAVRDAFGRDEIEV
jgi:hypothetical protein